MSMRVRRDLDWTPRRQRPLSLSSCGPMFFSAGGEQNQFRLQPSNAGAGDQFGTAVAINNDGTYFAATAPFEDSTASNAGSLYVFLRTSSWTEQAQLQASDAALNDALGSTSFGFPNFKTFTIALSDAGDRAVVGTGNDNSTDGAAYIFVRSGATWSEEQKLSGAVGAGDNFGFCTAMNAAGDYVAVAAPRKSAAGGGDAGVIYIYTRSGSTWSEQAQVSLTSGGGAVDSLGYAVALNSDATTLAATRLPGTTPTKVEIFTRSGSTWTHQQTITPSDTTGGGEFGISVALSSDGNTLVVGSTRHTTSVGAGRGAAYVFTRSGSTWTEQVKLIDPAGNIDDYFGASVSISGDASTVLVGAPQADTAGALSGAAFVFNGASWGTLLATLVGSDTTNNDSFGRSVAISRDGTWAVVGAHNDTNSGGASAGSVYSFDLSVL